MCRDPESKNLKEILLCSCQNNSNSSVETQLENEKEEYTTNKGNKTGKKTKKKKSVSFSPYVRVIKVESYKKLNFVGSYHRQESCKIKRWPKNRRGECFDCRVF